jgi:hypothetical protein
VLTYSVRPSPNPASFRPSTPYQDCIARVSQIASTCSMQSQEWVDADFDITNDKMPLPPAAVDENVVWAKASEIYDCGGELFLRSRTEDQHCHVEVGKYDSSALFSAATLLSYAQLQALVIAYDTYVRAPPSFFRCGSLQTHLLPLWKCMGCECNALSEVAHFVPDPPYMCAVRVF